MPAHVASYRARTMPPGYPSCRGRRRPVRSGSDRPLSPARRTSNTRTDRVPARQRTTAGTASIPTNGALEQFPGAVDADHGRRQRGSVHRCPVNGVTTSAERARRRPGPRADDVATLLPVDTVGGDLDSVRVPVGRLRVRFHRRPAGGHITATVRCCSPAPHTCTLRAGRRYRARSFP